jgi:hypothetical protein
MGIVLELGYVAKTVRRLEQVSLRATPKRSQMLDGGDACIHKHLRFS